MRETIDSLFPSVNYRADLGGKVRVELQDSEGRPLEGFGLSDCEPLTGDEVDAKVRWKGATTSRPNVRPFRIRFVLENATLFSMKYSDKR